MVFVIGCGKSDKLAADKQTASGSSPDTDASQAGDPAGPSELAIPPEIQTVANKLLGSSAEVLAFGDLAHNGHEQALVINRVIATPRAARESAPPETDGVPFTRAAVIERDGARWIQVLRCDEHLTNPKGFLAGAPLSPVTGWRVRSGTQFGNGSDKKDDAAQAFYFSPLDAQDAARAPTITVRWNPKVNRYQVVDRTSQQFLGELESLETPASTLR